SHRREMLSKIRCFPDRMRRHFCKDSSSSEVNSTAMLTTLLLAVAMAAPAPVPKAELVTVYEQSHFTKTGRYDEVIRLCAAYEKSYPGRVKCERFGTTPEGRPMLVL